MPITTTPRRPTPRLRTRAVIRALTALAASTMLAPRPSQAQKPSAGLTAREQTVVRAVDANAAAQLALLQRLVNINSGTMNFAGVRAVADVLRAEFESLGFTTRWVDGAPFGRAGHLVVEHPGPGPKLLLIGHLDTVFEPSSPFQKFQRLNDSTATGPGIIDMKGGDVIALYALRALKDAGLLDAMNVTMVLHGDEEDAGTPLSLARKTLHDEAQDAAAAIGFEDGPGDPRYGVIARRGATGWTLRSHGTAAHSSQIFQEEVGAGAAYESARALNGFYTTLAGERYLTFSPGLILGGTAVSLDSTGTSGSASGKSNVVAADVVVTGDLRTISTEQLSRARDSMRVIASRSLPGTSSEITFDDGYPPMAPTDANRALLGMYDQASRDLGLGPVAPVDPSLAGAADVSFVAEIVPMAIDALGLSGSGGHTTHETADLRQLPNQTKRAALLLYRFTVKKPVP